MATITTNEIVQTFGAAYQRYLELWADWLTDATKTLITTSIISSTFNTKAIAVGYTQGADTYVWNLCLATVYKDAAFIPPDYILSSPGWNATLPIIDATTTAKTIQTEFETGCLGVRKIVYQTLVGSGTVSWSSDNYVPLLTGYNAYRYRYAIRLAGFTAIDASQVTVKLAGTTVPVYKNAQITDGKFQGPVTLVGGSTIDLSGVVTALQDISHADIVTAVDNGSVVVLSKSGDTIP